MLVVLLLLSLLIWLPVLFFGIARQGFPLLLIWLLIAPVAVNVLAKPGTNPFFKSATKEDQLMVQPGQKIRRISQ